MSYNEYDEEMFYLSRASDDKKLYDVALRMLKNDFTVRDVVEISGLTKTQVTNLKKSIAQ
jgi:hypothetical protein